MSTQRGDPGYDSAMEARRWPPRRPSRRGLVVLLVLLGVLASACVSSSSDVIKYRDPDDHSLFEIPNDWHLYERSELGEVGGVPFAANFSGIVIPVEGGVAFDGAPAASPDNLAIPFSLSPYPIGSTTVRAITDEARDFISRSLLTQLVVPYDANEVVRELVNNDFDFGKNYEGVEVVVVYNDEATESDAGVYLISVTDPTVTRMYSMAVGCSLDCFNLHQDEIAKVMESWLVNTRLE